LGAPHLAEDDVADVEDVARLHRRDGAERAAVDLALHRMASRTKLNGFSRREPLDVAARPTHALLDPTRSGALAVLAGSEAVLDSAHGTHPTSERRKQLVPEARGRVPRDRAPDLRRGPILRRARRRRARRDSREARG